MMINLDMKTFVFQRQIKQCNEPESKSDLVTIIKACLKNSL